MKVTALYPGTFDPMTNGHSDLVARAAEIFDEVVVAVAENPGKGPLFTSSERVALACEVLSGVARVRVIGFAHLLIECARDQGALVIVRGLRAVSDFEYEFQMAGMNRQLDSRIQTVFLPTSDRDAYVSASLVKEVAKLGGDVSAFVHPAVKAALKARLG